MGTTGKGIDCGVVEWVKPRSLRWFGHMLKMNENKFVKRLYS